MDSKSFEEVLIVAWCTDLDSTILAGEANQRNENPMCFSDVCQELGKSITIQGVMNECLEKNLGIKSPITVRKTGLLVDQAAKKNRFRCTTIHNPVYHHSRGCASGYMGRKKPTFLAILWRIKSGNLASGYGSL